MKKVFFIAAAAAMFTFASCSKMTSDNGFKGGLETEKVSVYVSVVGQGNLATSKATGTVDLTLTELQTADEKRIHNLQVFVFNGDAVDGYGSVDNNSTIQLDCTAGSRDVYCLVNAPSTL